MMEIQKHAGEDMTIEQHKERHIFLHGELDKLISDILMLANGTKTLDGISILDMLAWSGKQARETLDHEAAGVSVVDHKTFHQVIHKAVDELVADWVYHQPVKSGVMLSRYSVVDLMAWSDNETQQTTDVWKEPVKELEPVEPAQQ